MFKMIHWQSAILFILGTVLITAIYLGDPALVHQLTIEDGVMEWLTAALYLAGAIAALCALVLKKHVPVAIVWMGLCVLFMGEETSWFQRLFDYSVPAVEQISAQGEFNLHNLDIFTTGNLLASDGQWNLSAKKFFNTQNLFRVGFGFYFLILPLLFAYSGKIRERLGKLGYVQPATGFLIAIWLIITLSFYYTVTSPEIIKNAIAETREMVYALVIFFYCLMLIAPAWFGFGQNPAPRS